MIRKAHKAKKVISKRKKKPAVRKKKTTSEVVRESIEQSEERKEELSNEAEQNEQHVEIPEENVIEIEQLSTSTNARSSNIKEVDDDFGPLGIVEEKPETLRDYFWNYPIYLVKLYNTLRPFSAIIIFGLICFWLFNFFISVEFIDSLKATEDNIFVEGSIGENVNINPIFLPQAQADRDIRELVFQKFVGIDKDGNPIAEIASKWETDTATTETDAGTEEKIYYTFYIDKNIRFSDGEKLTADDVIYTFQTGMDLARNYSKDTIGKALDNVSIEKVDDYTVKFTLDEQSATFFESVSVYIVPKHYYSDVAISNLDITELNNTAIGSGPYRIVNYKYNVITLEASEYFDPTPKIKQIEYRLYPDFESLRVAYENNMLDAVSNIGGESHSLGGNFTHYSLTLFTRKKLIFINNRLDQFQDVSLRRALSYIVNKENLLENTNIAGDPAYGPIYEGSWAYNESANYIDYDLDKAKTEFSNAEYTKNTENGFYQTSDGKILTVELTYLDNELNQAIAEELERQFADAGVILKLNPQDYDQITKETIATRNFELLLYEVETTIDPDQYNLWHSLKADYPNLNLAGFDYVRTDVELEKARKTTDQDVRKEEYKLFQKYFSSESPVIFLYYAHFDYFLSKDITVPEFDGIIYPEDRYNEISEWSTR